MRLGLVTDVHNHAAELSCALDLFRSQRVDQVVTIGDTCDAFSRAPGAAEVAALLRECGAIGVWGNHDFGLCREVTEKARSRYPEALFEFMAQMQPRLVLEDCHFSHKEANIDPHSVEQLWEVSDEPVNLVERANRGFAAAPQHCQFVGHYHRWWVATPQGQVAWDASQPLLLAPDQRYFVVVAAVCDGWCAVFDTAAHQLLPLQCSAG